MEERIWNDRKRIYGLPISFTKYYLTETRLLMENGLLLKTKKEIKLYEIKNIHMKQTILQRIINIGSIYIEDIKEKQIILENIKYPEELMDIISLLSDNNKKERIKITEKI